MLKKAFPSVGSGVGKPTPHGEAVTDEEITLYQHKNVLLIHRYRGPDLRIAQCPLPTLEKALDKQFNAPINHNLKVFSNFY